MIVRSLKALSSDRIQVLFDDGTESTLPTDLILRHNLHAGAEFPADFLQQLAMESESLRARDRGLSLLSYRMHSAKELRDKLLRKGFEASAVENAIAWLKDKAWLDDSRFASELAVSYLRKGFGKRRVFSELLRRGISRDLIAEVMDQLESESEEAAEVSPQAEGYGNTQVLIRRGTDRYLEKHLKNPEDRDEVRRVKSALFRKGYSSHDISLALERFQESHPSMDLSDD
ncbi:MAG: regulatory protein RecX [Oscillospiraceae bacterium]|nr:regulatory protein RecX [Oscillospiraceae bacterium]